MGGGTGERSQCRRVEPWSQEGQTWVVRQTRSLFGAFPVGPVGGHTYLLKMTFLWSSCLSKVARAHMTPYTATLLGDRSWRDPPPTHTQTQSVFPQHHPQGYVSTGPCVFTRSHRVDVQNDSISKPTFSKGVGVGRVSPGQDKRRRPPHLWEVAVVERREEEALGSRFVLPGGQLCQAWRKTHRHRNSLEHSY